MSIGLFIEKQSPPKESTIRAALGPSLDSWIRLGKWIGDTLFAQQEWKFMYGPKYGWARRFQRRGSLLTALYPTQSGFTAQIILNQAALRQVGPLKLGRNAMRAIERARPYAEGKWLLIPIDSERDAEDVRQLLALKIESGRRQGTKTHPFAA